MRKLLAVERLEDRRLLVAAILDASFLSSGTLPAGATSLAVNFSESVIGATSASNYELRRAGADGLLGNTDDPIVTISSVTMSGNTATLNFAALPEDVYRLTVKDTITDAVGNALDGDGNGTAGGNWRKDFVVGALSTSLTSPNGFMFDPEYGGLGAGQLVQGAANAFDGVNRLMVGGVEYNTSASSGPTVKVVESVLSGGVLTASATVASDSLVRLSGVATITSTAGVTGQLVIKVDGLQVRSFDLATLASHGPMSLADVSGVPFVAFSFTSGSLAGQSGSGRANINDPDGIYTPEVTYKVPFEDYLSLAGGLHTVSVELIGSGLTMAADSSLSVTEFLALPSIGPTVKVVESVLSGGVLTASATVASDSLVRLSGVATITSAAGVTGQLVIKVDGVQVRSLDLATLASHGPMSLSDVSGVPFVAFSFTSGSLAGQSGSGRANINDPDGMYTPEVTYKVPFEDYLSLAGGLHIVSVELIGSGLTMAADSSLSVTEFLALPSIGPTVKVVESVLSGGVLTASATVASDSLVRLSGVATITSAAGVTGQLVIKVDGVQVRSLDLATLASHGPMSLSDVSGVPFVAFSFTSGSLAGQSGSGRANITDPDGMYTPEVTYKVPIEDYLSLAGGLHAVSVELIGSGLTMAADSSLNVTEFLALQVPTTTDDARTIVTSSQSFSSLAVYRTITVPNVHSQDFTRTIDTFTNLTASAITAPVRIVGNLGSDVSTTVFATSDGDLNVEPTDLWFGTDDADGTGTPAIIHLLRGPFGLQPTSVNVIEDNVEWTYDLTVPAGATKRLASFTVLGTTRAEAIAAANALVTTNGFGGEAAAFLTAGELASLANFQFNTAPTDLATSQSSVAENLPTGSTVGTLTTVDGNVGDQFVYSLVSGSGDTDNSSVTIEAGLLKSNAVFNFEAKNIYAIRVRSTDLGGLSVEKQLTITVENALERTAPVQIGDGTVQRSVVNKLVVSFDQAIEFDTGAFQVYQRTQDSNNAMVLVPVTTNVSLAATTNGMTATLTFSGSLTRTGTNALVDGNYQLTINGGLIRILNTTKTFDADGDGNGGGLYTLGTQAADNFFALLGDANGNGEVDAQDLLAAKLALRKTVGQAGYNSACDINGNGVIDAQDILNIQLNLRKKRVIF